MKRFVNYTNSNGKQYEICATVMPMNGSTKLTLKFENLAKIDVIDFASECSEADFIWALNLVNLPFEGVSYISGAYNTDNELIRVIPKGNEKGEEN